MTEGMLSAKDAKKLTNARVMELVDTYIEETKGVIREAINKGLYRTRHVIYLGGSTEMNAYKEHFEKLGYDIEILDTYDDETFLHKYEILLAW